MNEMKALRISILVAGALWIATYLWLSLTIWKGANPADFLLLGAAALGGALAVQVLVLFIFKYMLRWYIAFPMLILLLPFFWTLGVASTLKVVLILLLSQGPPLIETSYQFLLSRTFGVNAAWIAGTVGFSLAWFFGKTTSKSAHVKTGA